MHVRAAPKVCANLRAVASPVAPGRRALSRSFLRVLARTMASAPAADAPAALVIADVHTVLFPAASDGFSSLQKAGAQALFSKGTHLARGPGGEVTPGFYADVRWTAGDKRVGLTWHAL